MKAFLLSVVVMAVITVAAAYGLPAIYDPGAAEAFAAPESVRLGPEAEATTE